MLLCCYAAVICEAEVPTAVRCAGGNRITGFEIPGFGYRQPSLGFRLHNPRSVSVSNYHTTMYCFYVLQVLHALHENCMCCMRVYTRNIRIYDVALYIYMCYTRYVCMARRICEGQINSRVNTKLYSYQQ